MRYTVVVCPMAADARSRAHFQNIKLGKAELQSQLSNYMARLGPFDTRHATIAAHADGGLDHDLRDC